MRVQVNMSDEMVKKIDDYAKTMGVSRSALCSMFIGEGVLGFDKSLSLLEEQSKGLLSSLNNGQ